MTIDIQKLLASRTSSMASSAIREILKVANRPGMVSLAGGIPAPETFPMDVLERIFTEVLRRWGSSAFQYDLTEGFVPLREASVDYLRRYSVETTGGNILITSGSQGLLDALGKILISPGDKVVVETPTYLGALQAFNPYGPKYLEMESDESGVIPESLEEILKKNKPKFIYMVPTFQNPSGRTLPLERRRIIADLIVRYGVLLVEDDPYAALRYKGVTVPSIRSMAPDHVLYATTYSKVFAPGLRVGLAVPPDAELGNWLVKAKQGTDLHTSTLSQALAAAYLDGGYLDRQLPVICGHYAPRLESMLAALEEYFPQDWLWSRPDGGMFVWAEGPPGTDIPGLYDQALSKNIAFVPGRYFFADPSRGGTTMRLNFSSSHPDVIRTAVRVLSELIQ